VDASSSRARQQRPLRSRGGPCRSDGPGDNHISMTIHVPVPTRWRIIGLVFTIVCLIALGGALHFLFGSQYQDGFTKFICVLHILLTPVLIALVMPCFIQRYPAWVVRIFGREWLLRLIDECHRHLGAHREQQAVARDPGSWIRDQRWLWLLIVGAAIVLGVVNARMN